MGKEVYSCHSAELWGHVCAGVQGLQEVFWLQQSSTDTENPWENLQGEAAFASQVSILKGNAVHLRNFWVSKASASFPLLSSAAKRLLSAHVTTAAAERNWSVWGQIYQAHRNQLGIKKAEQVFFIKGNLGDDA